jgi:hypothetical protein
VRLERQDGNQHTRASFSIGMREGSSQPVIWRDVLRSITHAILPRMTLESVSRLRLR